MMRIFSFVLVTLSMVLPGTVSAEEATELHVFFGTYTGGKSKGIYHSTMDLDTGKLTKPTLVATTDSPSFLAIHPNGKYLYAVNEIGKFKGEKSGAVSAFSLDPKTGKLTYLNQQSSKGAAPCHLVVDKAGQNVLVANYTGGSVAVLPIEEGGKLKEACCAIQHEGSSVDPRRQKEPHAHSINLDAANRFAFAADLGLDKILVYRFDPRTGKLTPNDPPSVSTPKGGGPRHFAFHPSGKFAYVINEMQLTVTAMTYNPAKGILTVMQTLSTVPKGTKTAGFSTAEVQVHPSGRFVYGSNRGHNSIVAYRVDERSGKLTYIGNQGKGIKIPRNFGIDPSGRFMLVANQAGNSVVVFKIDPKTGKLEPTDHKIEVPSPVCVKFLTK